MTSHSLRLDLLARLGFSAKGVLYGVVGLLAFQAAIGEGGRITDSAGALRAIVRQPFGHTLLLVLAIGLFGYAAWRMLEGIVDHERRGNDLKDLAVRGSYVARGVLHAYLGWKVFQLYRGFSARGNSQEQLVAETFTWPLGEWMVILTGLGLLGFAVYQIFRATTTKLGRHFDVEGLRRDIGGWAVAACRAGSRRAVSCSALWRGLSSKPGSPDARVSPPTAPMPSASSQTGPSRSGHGCWRVSAQDCLPTEPFKR